jgi:hypothetical protein
MTRRPLAFGTCLVALALVATAAAGRNATAGFSARVDNPWFPLKPGSTYVYRGVKDGKPSRDVFVVTHRTRTVDGAPCVVVVDRLYLGGVLEERTTEWYSQDRAGNVWYFGETTAELDARGHVKSRSGSWEAGKHGARAGLFMFARPRLGRSARQEYLAGQAEDHFQVLGLDVPVRVPFVASRHALLTKEWTPLEPGTIDHKLYVKGVGTVLEQTVKGGDERNALVSFTRG